MKYGYPRPRSRARSRTTTLIQTESPILDLSHRGNRSRSGSQKRRTPLLDENTATSPEAPVPSPHKHKNLVLPPAPDVCERIYGGRADPYEAPECLSLEKGFDFCVRKSGIWLKESDLRTFFIMLACIFLTSLTVAFTAGYITLSRHLESTPKLGEIAMQCSDPSFHCQNSKQDLYMLENGAMNKELTLSKRQDIEPEIGFDFSLSTLGAKILSTRETKPVAHYDATVLGYSIWRGMTSDTHNDAPLQPILMPGRCWRFYGFPGTLVIQLAENVVVTSFTLSHVLGASVPKSRLKSAPYEFEVWGLQELEDQNPHLFGNYTLLLNGASNQDFPVIYPTVAKMPIVELKVLSNYGSMEFTCVYRFKVFGIPQEDLLTEL